MGPNYIPRNGDGGLFPIAYVSLIEIGGKNPESKIFLEADGVIQFIEIM